MNLKECYLAAGADYEDVMRRFLREERVDRFLAMFLKDQSFDLLCSSMVAGRYEEAFRAVHTMKGICMNLSLNTLLEACVALTENLRTGHPAKQTAQYYETVKAEYQKTAAAIRSHLN